MDRGGRHQRLGAVTLRNHPASGHFAPSSQAENTEIYRSLLNPFDFRDIVFGNCGLKHRGLRALGWDFCTGIASDIGHQGK
jgi:hypothetical protein